MEPDPTLIESLRRAVDAMPDDIPLRLHLATLLIEAGRRDDGVREIGAILQRDPANAAALALISSPPAPGRAQSGRTASDPETGSAQPARGAAGQSGTGSPAGPAEAAEAAEPGQFDWHAAESELADVLPPRFVGPDGTAEVAADGLPGGSRAEAPVFDAEHAGLRLADVAGLDDVKRRLEAAFLAPMRNPDLRRLYAKSLRGGLLLYGPPGCGKTFIARAVAGELGARFLAVSFADVIDSMLGQSERNIHEIFDLARRSAPCVVFLDEVDAIGQKRTQLRHTPMRAVVNQLLLELDDVGGGNEGVFLLAATNHPWDVDSALRRPGRFDRMLLVLPPDQAARAAVFRYHLRERPVERVDADRLAKRTEGYSGADIAHICETAAERALLDSVRRGEPRMIGQADLEAAIGEVRPSLGPWFDAARNVAMFANEGGAYDDLAAYLKRRRML